MQTEKTKITLRLGLDGGIVNGKQAVHNRSFAQLDIEATDQALYDTAKALADCYADGLITVTKLEESTMSENIGG